MKLARQPNNVAISEGWTLLILDLSNSGHDCCTKLPSVGKHAASEEALDPGPLTISFPPLSIHSVSIWRVFQVASVAETPLTAVESTLRHVGVPVGTL